MLTPEGTKVIEYNVRFGDPETQVLMNTTRGDLYHTLRAAARGELERGMLEGSGEHAVCVVLAAAGYPDAPRKGDPISGIEEAERVAGVRVYHAGTAIDGKRLITAGGRVLGVTAREKSLEGAHTRAYAAAACIQFEGMQFRRDIARRALA
jgi:phosphoribosylamine--glycine ligase